MSDLDSIKELYNQLLKKAKEDGTITSEEQAILDQIKLDISNYEKLVNDALEDAIITEDEANQLREYRAKMLDDAWLVADQDSVINQDEAGLLNLLLKLLKKMELN